MYPELYNKVCNDLDCLLYDEHTDWDSLEGLNSNIAGRLFVSICDTFGQILKTGWSNIVNVNKSIKRSELCEFVASNALKTRTVDNLPYEKCIDTEMDVPANMKGTYKAAVAALVQVYLKLNALNNGKLVDTAFREALNSINTNDPKLSKQVESTAQIVKRIVDTATPAINMAMSQFDGKFSYKRPFHEVFLTKQEWVETRKMLLDCESRLQEVRPLTEVITSMEGTLKAIAQAAELNETPVSPRDLKNMGETAKNVALLFDAFGMATTRQMTLEHNYVLCINNLYDNVK